MANMEEIQTLIKDCENRESRLSDWERSFIDSISHQIARGNGLTTKQEQTLNDIWDKVT